MTFRHGPLSVGLLTLAAAGALARGLGAPSAEPPAWYFDHLQEQMRHGGRRVADNAEYQSAAEPFDAYGIEWSWGIGRRTLRGRLFALQNGIEAGDQWEMHTAWHPGEGEARAYQFGADGTFVTGWIRPLGGGGFEIEQTAYAPDGSTRETRHESFAMPDGGEVGASFRRGSAGEWVEDRSYTWLPSPLGESRSAARSDN